MSRSISQSKPNTNSANFRVENPFHWTLYRYLGAHPGEHEGKSGVHFAVWAPNASEVSVLSDRNGWQVSKHLLHPSDRGVWAGFLPDYKSGETYKIRHSDRLGANS
ncbi:MAG: hypothetical protein R3C11_20705 [Planctomycetaceae bacterium]